MLTGDTFIDVPAFDAIAPILIGNINLEDKDKEEPVENVGEQHEVA